MSILEVIGRAKQAEAAELRSKHSLAELRSMAADAPPVRPFAQALLSSAHQPSLIAEVKKASPSKGVIRADFDPKEIAAAYANAGADCLSVLTDRDFFQGGPENLAIAREASGLPCLRKDFIVDEAQVLESRALGADCILLIAAMLSAQQLREWVLLASSLGMDALVEVHNEAEAGMVPDESRLVGVNNRSLHTFAEDLGVTARLFPALAAPGRVLVSESSLASLADVQRVREAGARAVLIGTTFCAAPQVGVKVKEVMGW